MSMPLPLPTVFNPETIKRFWNKVAITAQENLCWLWTGSTRRRGYGVFNFKRPLNLMATRVAYFLHYKVDPLDKLVLHKCDNPKCCNPTHLFLGTTQDNTADMDEKGRRNSKVGEAHWKVKVTAEMVKDIRSMAAAGESQKNLSVMYGIDASNISLIVSRKTWKHIV